MNDKSECEAEHTYGTIQSSYISLSHLTAPPILSSLRLNSSGSVSPVEDTLLPPRTPSYPSWDFRSASNNVSGVIFVNFSPHVQPADGCVGWWRKMGSVIDWFDWCYKDNRYQLCVVVQVYCLGSQYPVNPAPPT